MTGRVHLIRLSGFPTRASLTEIAQADPGDAIVFEVERIPFRSPSPDERACMREMSAYLDSASPVYVVTRSTRLAWLLKRVFKRIGRGSPAPEPLSQAKVFGGMQAAEVALERDGYRLSSA